MLCSRWPVTRLKAKDTWRIHASSALRSNSSVLHGRIATHQFPQNSAMLAAKGACPCTPCMQPPPRRACRVQAAGTKAAKGFGFSLPKMPSFGGKQPRLAPGSVEPAEPIDLCVPPEVDQLWEASLKEWIRFSIDQPVILKGGAAVHLVAIGHDQPSSARLIAEAAYHVHPDAIAVESPPQVPAVTCMHARMHP